jgi:tetratricopeptide (TPR) repeat protein
MLLIPSDTELRLVFARSGWEPVGLLAALACASLFAPRVRRRLPGVAPGESSVGASLLWGALLPSALVVAHVGLQLLALQPGTHLAREDLAERALEAFADQRYQAAAEYARHALEGSVALRDEMLCLRGDSLLRTGHAREAAVAYEAVLRTGLGPYQAQALYGAARAYDAAGDGARATSARERLSSEFPDTPWARLASRPASN